MTRENKQVNKQKTTVQTSSDHEDGTDVSLQQTSVSHHTEDGSVATKQTIESATTVQGKETTTQTEIHVSGRVEAGNQVTITVLRDNSPVADADVLVNDEPVDMTNKGGSTQIIVPEEDSFTLEVSNEQTNSKFQMVTTNN